MTLEEITKLAFEVFPKPNRSDYPNDEDFGNAIVTRSLQRDGYIKALTDFNVHNINVIRGQAYMEMADRYEALPKIKGYVARDRDGSLAFWGVMPYRWLAEGDTPFSCYVEDHWHVPGACYHMNLAYADMFQDLKWEDEPIPVNLYFKKENNNG